MSTFFIGRQPIIDRKEQIAGYEILFRSEGATKAEITDNRHATARVLVNMLQNFSIETLLGGRKGFINVDDKMILDGTLDILPKDKLVFEILETSEINKDVIDKIVEYRENGYSFALDDLEFTKEYFMTFREIFPLVDFIKVDYLLCDKAQLFQNIDILKKFRAKLLAEKVETAEEHTICRELGFDLFQGYYFAKPTVISQKAVDPSKAAIIHLINMLRKDADVKDVEDVIKTHPDLYINLMKFMNSAAFFTQTEIKSIKHAIALIGRKNLTKWLYLILYAGTNNDSFSNPLLLTAQIRAKAMELMCEKSISFKNKADSAYIAGIMSLLDVVFNKDLKDIVDEFHIDPEIKKAVVDFEGEIGAMLKILKYYEADDVEKLMESFQAINMNTDEFNSIMTECYSQSENSCDI
ncbi:MAG: EAL and HDOD domain-containing protein [Deferribacterales bacterium]